MGTVLGRNCRPRGRAVLMITAAVAAMLSASHGLHAQTSPLGGDRIAVVVRWSGGPTPSGINGPIGDEFEKQGSQFVGSVSRPVSGVTMHDLEVVYGDQAYPLRLRIHPQTEKVQVAAAIEQPKSCANVYLRRLEKPTLTQISSVKAALTLGYMIDGRTGANSCDQWPLRAARARFERYQNAMERSIYLVIPEAVKDALRATATTEGERNQVSRVIAEGEKVERQRLAIALQNSVLAELKSGDVTAAFRSSSLLLETSRKPEFASAVATQIDPVILEKQTVDLGIRSGVTEPSTDVPPDGAPRAE